MVTRGAQVRRFKKNDSMIKSNLFYVEEFCQNMYV